MIKLDFNSNTVFSGVLIFFFLLIVYRITPPHVDAVLELVLSKNNGHIATIDQQRAIGETRTVMIDRVNLYERNRLSHPKLGPLGWSDDFFLDMNTRFKVKEADTYHFLIGSDDGFLLKVDDQELCRFPGDRGYAQQRCSARLTTGEHELKLSYFQGYGHSGLTLQYQKGTKGKFRYWGDDSHDLKIIVPKK